MSRSMSRRLLGRGALALAVFAVQATWSAQSQAGTKLVFGTVEEDAKQETQEFAPITAYLEQHLASAGVDEVRVSAHTSIESIAAAIARGQIDLYIDSVILAAIVGRDSGAQPFLRAWKDGEPEYHTLFYARTNSGLTSLDDLRGKVIAFKAPESTPGHLLPRAHLLQQGYRLVELQDPSDPVPSDAIGYVFAHGDRTALAWVMKGTVAAATVKNNFFDDAAMARLRERIAILGETPPVPRQALMLRPGFDPALRARLETVLLEMDQTEVGRTALQTMNKTAKFDHFPGGAEAAFARIRAMLDVLDQERGPNGAKMLIN
jgi:phosphate/phosphite/phosphonate ABC transporter binding protein